MTAQASLAISEEQELTSAAHAAIAAAHSLEIQGDSDLFLASQLMDGFKKAKKSVEDFFKPTKDNAHKSHKAVCEREKDMLAPFLEADRAVKAKVSAFLAEQRIQAEAEAARIKTAQEKESQRLMEQAVAAEAYGNAAAAESLFKQASLTETLHRPAPQEKVRGISCRTAYTVVVEDIGQVPCEADGVVIRPVDESKVRELARTSKGAIQIPGIRITEVQEVYSSRRW